MTSKYTPGPWRAIAEDIINGSYLEPSVITDGDRPTQTIAVIRIGLEGSEANARLIAASPDLLEACKELRVRLIELFNRRERETYINPFSADHDLSLLTATADAAIRKAEGHDRF